MFDNIRIYDSTTSIPYSLKTDFIRVYVKAFGAKEKKALNISQKYFSKTRLRNGAFLCTGYVNGNASAFYCSRLVETTGKDLVVLSMDTMSDGRIKNSVAQLTECFYPFLLTRGIKKIVGFPNINIIGLRIHKLGWEYIGSYQLQLRFKAGGRRPIFQWYLPREGLFWRFNNALNSVALKIYKNNYFPFQLNLVLRRDINIDNLAKFQKKRTIKHLCVKYLEKPIKKNFSKNTIPILPFESIDVP